MVRGWAQAREWGLRTVVDLRCDYEKSRSDHDPCVGESAWSGVTIVDTPTEDHDDADFRSVCFPILDSPVSWAQSWRLQPHLVRTALVEIASARSGVLVHCSAGRDRTGMIVALVLGNAGVALEAVAADYARSVHAMAGVASHAPTVDQQTTWTSAEVDAWLVDKLPVVEQAARTTREVLDRLEVTHQIRRSLRTLLTDPDHRDP